MIRTSFEKEKGKTWKKPYLKCLSHKVLLKYYKGVSNLSQEWQKKISRDLWDDNYGRPNYRNGYQIKYAGENRNWGQRNEYGRGYGSGISRERPMGGLLLKFKHTTPPQREESPIEIHHLEELVVDREMVMGMVKIRMIRIEDIEIPSMILRKKMRKRVILKILLSLKLLHNN